MHALSQGTEKGTSVCMRWEEEADKGHGWSYCCDKVFHLNGTVESEERFQKFPGYFSSHSIIYLNSLMDI